MENRRKTFDEIEVKRISIVDDNGVPRMMLSGKPSHPGLFRGEKIIERTRPEAGLLFFTEEGTECGGLAFRGELDKGRVNAGGIFTMDAYEQDQVIWINHSRRRQRTNYGLVLAEQPFSPLNELVERVKGYRKYLFILTLLASRRERRKFRESHALRFLLGRQRGDTVGAFIYDSKRRPRLRMVVDGAGRPRIEFLNESKKVTHTLSSGKDADGEV